MTCKLLHTKVKAGALQYTIFIAVVIALLVFAFIGLTFVQQKLRIKNTFFKEVIHQNDLAFKYLKNKNTPYNEQQLLPVLTTIETSSIKKHWGIFDIISINSKKGKENFTKTAFLAAHQKERPAIYLQDQNQPLVLVGTSRIKGKAYLPKQGVKRGTIAGHSYTNNQLIYGTTSQSTNKLPEIQNIAASIDAFRGKLNKGNAFIELEQDLKVINSFNQPTKIIRSIAPLVLQFIELSGNIIIQSDTKITVYATAQLKDVILIAPSIEIKNNVKGNFQAFATKKIIVGENCELSYPTALVLTEKKNLQTVTTQNNRKEINQIVIDKSTKIKGTIAFITENKEDTYKPQILLEENTIIVGEVYCNQNIELKGTVKGSIYTKGFIASQFGSVYKNHIYNGNILSNDLPEQYCGLSFKNSTQNVAKWLYY